jgi:hypothetical protein
MWFIELLFYVAGYDSKVVFDPVVDNVSSSVLNCPG